MAFDALQLQAGDLRHSITIQSQNTGAADAFGNPSSTWTDVLQTRAKIEGTTSKAVFQALSVSAQASEVITIRYPGPTVTITPGMRVVHGSNIYIIEAVDNVLRRNRVVRLICTSVDEGSN